MKKLGILKKHPLCILLEKSVVLVFCEISTIPQNPNLSNKSYVESSIIVSNVCNLRELSWSILILKIKKYKLPQNWEWNSYLFLLRFYKKWDGNFITSFEVFSLFVSCVYAGSCKIVNFWIWILLSTWVMNRVTIVLQSYQYVVLPLPDMYFWKYGDKIISGK